jgi:hypothetical protein
MNWKFVVKCTEQNKPFCMWLLDHQNKMVDTQQASHTLLHPKTTYGLKKIQWDHFLTKYTQRKVYEYAYQSHSIPYPFFSKTSGAI